MSFKFPSISDVSIFDILFNNSTDKIPTTDPNSFTMNINIKNNSDSFLRFLGYTSFTVGYINNTRTQHIKEIGSFIIIINSQTPGGANGIFCISRSDKSKSGKIQELVKTDGVLDDIIDLEWNPHEYPLLKTKFKLSQHKQDVVSYHVKVISNF